MTSNLSLALVAAGCLVTAPLSGAHFSIEPSRVDVVANPGVNHYPVRVPVTYTTTPRVGLSAASDASWATPSMDAATGDLVVALSTSTLINRSYTATITVTDGTDTDQVFVQAMVSPLNIVALADDPVRNRVYAVQQDGVNAGALLVFDPLAGGYLGSLTLGQKPHGLAVSQDGAEAIVICSVSRTIAAIDLDALALKETMVLPDHGNWGVEATFARIDYGPGGVLYYTDCNWAPSLHVFDRASRTVLQSIAMVGDGDGFGDFAVSPDQTQLFAWSQYGWHAGWGGSDAARFSLAADGRATPLDNTPADLGFDRDPLSTPVLVSADGQVVIVKEFAFSATSFASTVRTFPGPVFAMTPEAEIVATDRALYEFTTGNKVAELPVASTVQVITSDYARLVYFDPFAQELKSFNLLEAIGDELLGRVIAPVDGAITTAPAKLEWTGMPGIDRYQVYLGTDEAEVGSATTASASYLGEVNGTSINIAGPFDAGMQYFWRVDVVTEAEVSPGEVHSFTVSPIATSLSAVSVRTVRGHADYRVPIDLTSATVGEAWSAATDSDWITPETEEGTTPATLTLSLNAATLPPGVQQGSVTLGTSAGEVTIPVRLEVEALHLTVIRSDPQSEKVYAVSEAPSTGTARAYLLEIDSTAKTITRVVPAGRSVTDIAIHAGDDRVYVTNWQIGSLLAFDRTTLELEQSYPFEPFAGVGYGREDVYRVAAGGPGRVLVEPEDQWVTISIYDTTTGTTLGQAGVREGGGQYGADLRYYYHGENNSSGATLQKYDTLADALTLLAGVRVEHTSYYGSRVVVVSEDGSRIFWAGGVFTTGLTEEWALKDIIYSTSRTGRYAFGESKIYDVDARTAILGMPATTQVSAFNSTSEHLIVQTGDHLGFYKLTGVVSHPTPVLTVGEVKSDRITLTWTDESLETHFTMQYRTVGEIDWTDLASPIDANVVTYTLTGLQENNSYEFRIKAESATVSSGWSNEVTATTPVTPPNAPQLYSYTTGATRAHLQWWVYGTYDSITLERRLSSGNDWTVITTVVNGDTASYWDTGLTPSTGYVYRARTNRAAASSDYSSEVWVTTTAMPTPPFITSQPRNVTVAAGQFATLSVQATGSALEYQWYKDGEPVEGANSSWLYLYAVTTHDAGEYTVRVSNDAGSVVSETAIVQVTAPSFAGIYFGTFANGRGHWALIVRADLTATFIAFLTDPAGVICVNFVLGPNGTFNVPAGIVQGAATGLRVAADPVSCTLRGSIAEGVVAGMLDGPGVAFAGTIEAAQGSTAATAGLYTAGGIGRATGVLYTVVGTRGNVLVVTQTDDLAAGGVGTCSAAGQVSIPDMGQSSVTGTVNPTTMSVMATVSSSANASTFATILPGNLRTDRLVNISSRGVTGLGDNVMIGGFVVSGSGPRTMLIRGAGPALRRWSVPGVADDPIIRLYDKDSRVLFENDNWGAAENLSALIAATETTQAFAFDDGSKDAALLVQLVPGSYTAITGGKDGTIGNVLTEVYDVTSVAEVSPAVVNLSIRAHAGTGDDLVIAGFVVLGNSPKRVLIRAVGPALASVGGMDPAVVLADPTLKVMQGSETVVENDDWDSSDPDVAAAFSSVGAFSLPDASKDSAILTTLLPGAYTAHAVGHGEQTGIVLVEVYQLD